ncbi:MAG: hypothetical protein MUE50_04540 [Pirellulaceae bacterium]|nr:hypothetical protein [Pirellulaceae bacterium]
MRGMKLYRDEDGVFLEHGGGDSSYQAVCLLRLQEIVCTCRIAARGLPTRRRRAWGGPAAWGRGRRPDAGSGIGEQRQSEELDASKPDDLISRLLERIIRESPQNLSHDDLTVVLHRVTGTRSTIKDNLLAP